MLAGPGMDQKHVFREVEQGHTTLRYKFLVDSYNYEYHSFS